MECWSLYLQLLKILPHLHHLWSETPSEKLIMDLKQVRGKSELGVISWKCPKWNCGFLWVCDASPWTPSASFTEIAAPLLTILSSEIHNPIPNSTILSHPHLFKLVTPIKVEHFKLLLALHPNQPLIKSVVWGLRDGFWPFTNFDSSAPDTWDNSTWLLKGPNLLFTLKQWDEEIKKTVSPLPLGLISYPGGIACQLVSCPNLIHQTSTCSLIIAPANMCSTTSLHMLTLVSS